MCLREVYQSACIGNGEGQSRRRVANGDAAFFSIFDVHSILWPETPP